VPGREADAALCEKLAALVPRPRTNAVLYHGTFSVVSLSADATAADRNGSPADVYCTPVTRLSGVRDL